MAVVGSACQSKSRAPEGGKNLGKESYSCFYVVNVDSESDGPQTVLNAPGLPEDRSAYTWGNDYSPNAVLVDMKPLRVTRFQWVVQCFYEEQDEDGAGGGTLTDNTFNPELSYPILIPGFVSYTETVEDAEFIEVYQKPHVVRPAPDGWTKGDRMPVSNSANVPVIPAIERKRHYDAFRMVWWFTSWNSPFKDSIGKTNIETVNVNFSHNGQVKFSDTYQPDQMYCASITPRDYVYNGVFWYEITTEIHINRDGWFTDILDEGFEIRVDVGDSDGTDSGQYVAGDFSGIDTTKTRRIVGPDGAPTTEKALLNGNGKLSRGYPDPPPANYIRYRVPYQRTFSALVGAYAF